MSDNGYEHPDAYKGRIAPDVTPGSILREPPNDIEAERAVLGAMLLDEDMAKAVTPTLAPSDFYRQVNGEIFRIIGGMVVGGDRPDPLVVATLAEKNETIRQAGGLEYLRNLVLGVATSANGKLYAKRVAEMAALRKVIYHAMMMQAAAYDREPAIEVLERNAAQGELLKAQFTDLGGAAAISFTDFDTLESSRTHVQWLARGIVAEGAVTIIAGHPKVAGKSTFVYGMIAALARGDCEYAGFATPKQTRAVVLSEESAPTIHEKRGRFGDLKCVGLTREDAFPPKPLRIVVEAAVKEAKQIGATLLVVDPWNTWANFSADGEKDADATRLALQPLLWASSQGMAVVIIHHFRKADGEDGTAARGSSAFFGAVDVLVEMRPFGNGKDASAGPSKARILTTRSRFEETPAEVIIELDGAKYVRVGSATEQRVRALEGRVVELLATKGGWETFDEVADELSAKHPELRVAINALVARGAIRRLGAGVKGSGFRYGAATAVESAGERKPTPGAGAAAGGTG